MRLVVAILMVAMVATAWFFFANISSVRETGRTLDVVIQGEGFLQVLDDATGYIHYTRNGHLELGANRDLEIRSSTKAYLVEPAINIPEDATNIVINSRGEVLVERPDESELCSVGQIELVRFENTDALEEVDDGVFRVPVPFVNCPGEDGFGAIVQGKLEVVK